MKRAVAAVLRAIVFGMTLFGGSISAAEDPAPVPAGPDKPAAPAPDEAEALLLLFRYAAAQDAHAALHKAFAGQVRELAEGLPEGPARLDAETEARVRKLIAELGADDFQAREKATEEVRKLGKPALPLLIEAKTGSRDAEVVTRAEGLIDDLSDKKQGGPLPWSKVEGSFARTVMDGAPLAGYRFSPVAKDAEGKELGTGRHALVAAPADAGKAGKPTFLCCAELKAGQAGWTVWAKDTGGKAPDALPADPGKDGWKRADGVPAERKARGGLETNAVGSCRAYAEAQTIFHRNDWDNDGIMEYAARFPLLASTLDATGTPIQFLDGAFARALTPKNPKHGYYFVDMVSIAGAKIDFVTEFGVCAVPAVYGPGTRRTFIVTTMGTVFAKDTGGKPVFDFPKDPGKAGWIVAE